MSGKQTETNSKQSIIHIVVLLLALVLIGIFSYYGYSRYRTVVKGQAEGPIAKWSFNSKNNGESITQDIDLTSTMSVDSEIRGKKQIQPGTKGSFDLELSGSGSESSIDYTIEIDLTQKPDNLILYRNDTHTNKLKAIGETEEDSGKQNTGIGLIEGYIELDDINKGNASKKETIYWVWPYETGDTEEEVATNDEIDSEDMGKSYNLPITVTGVQRDTNVKVLKQGITTVSKVTESGGTESADKCKTGDTIDIQVTFNDDVYNLYKKEMKKEEAPVMQIRFGDKGDGEVAKFYKAEGNNLHYRYKLYPDDDIGALEIVKYIGNVYNEEGTKLEVEPRDIVGKNITSTLEMKTSSAGSKYVDLETDLLSGEANEWELLYDGTNVDGYIYFMLSDYLPCNKIPTEINLQKTNEYKVSATTNRNDLINVLGNINESYNENTKKWKNMLPKRFQKIRGITVAGTPDLVLWVKSWNAVGGTTQLYTLGDTGIGYYVGNEEKPKTTSYTIENQAERRLTTHFMKDGDFNGADTTHPEGYWLSSLASVDSTREDVMLINCKEGKIGYANFDSTTYGIRPVVRISSILITK